MKHVMNDYFYSIGLLVRYANWYMHADEIEAAISDEENQ